LESRKRGSPRSFKPSKQSQYRRQEFRHRKPAPMPIGDRCHPLCPLFRCTRGALVVLNRSYRGRMVKEAYCRLSGEKCVGVECRFAGCRMNALLPDGKCAKALEKKMKLISEEELFREMQQIEDYDAEDFMR